MRMAYLVGCVRVRIYGIHFFIKRLTGMLLFLFLYIVFTVGIYTPGTGADGLPSVESPVPRYHDTGGRIPMSR